MTMTLLRRHSAALTAAFLGATLVLTACGSADSDPGTTSGETRQIEADNGTVKVPADPQRIAAIGNASLPLIDLGGEPVGVTEIAASRLHALSEEQQTVYDAATDLGPSGGEVDLELLASINPDLIIISIPDSDFEEISEQLTSIAPTVFVGFNSDWKVRADTLAKATNKSDALSDIKAEYDEHVAKIKETYSEILNEKTFINANRFDGQDPGMFYVGSNCGLEAAGEEVGLKLADGEYEEPLSYEQLAEVSKYDVILYPADGEGQVQEPFVPVIETNTWKALPTVNSGNAQGVYCPGEMAISYGFMLQYVDSLDRALAALPTKE